MKIVAIIQARMGSERLPGKVLKKVLNKPLLEYQIERVKRAKYINEIVVATTLSKIDEPIIKLCKKLSVSYYRGSERNVLSRYYKAAKEHNADIIVRITGDCPIIDPCIIDKVIMHFVSNSNKYDFVSNVIVRSYPRGMDTEVFTFGLLNAAFLEATSVFDLEHVTPFFYRNPTRFRLANVSYKQKKGQYRLTVDTIEDFILVKKIVEALYPNNPNFTLEDTLELFKTNPHLILINQHVEQNRNE